MPTEKERRRSAVETEMRAYQAVYDNYRYNDAQRERAIEFIGAAMKVMRGDAPFDSLKQLLNVRVARPAPGAGQSYRGGTHFELDGRVLSDWTRIYVIATTDAQGQIEPYHFQIHFGPAMNIPRERLEQMLGLKVVPGWTSEGGNLQFEVPDAMNNLPAFNGGNFEYGLIDPPHAPYTVQTKFTYLNGPDKDPYTATRLSSLEIRREYLSPEKIRERDHKKLGHLPTTGQRVPNGGRWLGVFADDALTASVPMQQRLCTFGEGQVFTHLWIRGGIRREPVPVQTWWQWQAPDPLEDEFERMFGSKRRG